MNMQTDKMVSYEAIGINKQNNRYAPGFFQVFKLASEKKTKETSLKPGFKPVIHCLDARRLINWSTGTHAS